MGGGFLHTGATEVVITRDLQGPPDLVLPQNQIFWNPQDTREQLERAPQKEAGEAD